MSTAKTAKNSAKEAAEAAKQTEEAAVVSNETAENVVKANAEVADKAADKPVSLTRDHVDTVVRAGADAFAGYQDVLQFGKDNVEALVRSSTIVVRGVQDLSKTVVSLAQESIEDSVATGKALIGAKTLKEVVDLSSALLKSNFDKVVAESARLGQMSTKLAEEAFAPLNSRFEVTVQKLTRPGA